MIGENSETLNIRKGMGREAAENLAEWLARRFRTKADAIAGVTTYFGDPDAAHTFMGRILEEPGPILSAELELLLNCEVARQWARTRAGWDSISQLSVATTNEQRGWNPYWLYNEDIWTKGLTVPGNFGIISGEGQGLGKTSLGVRHIAGLTKQGHHALTNIRVTDMPDEARSSVHYVTRFSDIFRKGIELRRQNIKWACYIDETNMFASRQDAMGGDVKNLDKGIRWFRKFNGSLVLITHFEKLDVPEKLRMWITNKFEKLDQTRMRVSIRTRHFQFSDRIRNVPDIDREAGWDFDTYGMGGLDVDVDVEHLSKWMNAQAPKTYEQELDLVIRYLDERPDPEDASPGSDDEPEVDHKMVIVDEIRANPGTYRLENGKADIDAIAREFPDYVTSTGKAYDIARLVRARGWVAA